MAALTEHFQILRYDMRGHGASEAPAGPYSMEMLSDDVIGLWNALGIRRSHFVGLSIGGMIGQTLALNIPTDWRDWFFAAPPVAYRHKAAPCGMIESARWRRAGWSRRWTACSSAGFLRNSAAPAGCGRPDRRNDPRDAGTGLPVSRAIQSFDVTERLGAIIAPTLLMPGEKDPGTLPAFSETIHRLVPKSRLAVVPDSAHLSNIEQPKFVAQAILDFLLMLETSEKPEKAIKIM